MDKRILIYLTSFICKAYSLDPQISITAPDVIEYKQESWLHCLVENKPGPVNTKISKNGDAVSEKCEIHEAMKERYTWHDCDIGKEEAREEYNLSITSPDCLDEGKWRCYYTVGEGFEAFYQLQLQVTVNEAKIEDLPNKTTIGSTLLAKCVTECVKPNATITWFVNGKQQSSGKYSYNSENCTCNSNVITGTLEWKASDLQEEFVCNVQQRSVNITTMPHVVFTEYIDHVEESDSGSHVLAVALTLGIIACAISALLVVLFLRRSLQSPSHTGYHTTSAESTREHELSAVPPVKTQDQ